MNCSILSTLYLRANGEIPCYDDAGGNLTLASLNGDRRFEASEIFSNPQYTHIRESLFVGRMPWTNVCKTCAMLRPDEEYTDGISRKHIKTFQVEPTLACALACPACTQREDLKKRRKPLKMGPEVFDTMLRALSEDQYNIDLIEYCGNGEPLNHPKFADFVRLARQHYPQTKQRLVTNGNFEYSSTIGAVHIDQIMVSCDGATQGSYEKYRVGGNIEKVFSFMRDIHQDVAGYKQNKIWKYILFEFNDSDEELQLAQKISEDLGFDQIIFVGTHSRFASRRFSGERIRDLPLIIARASTDLTPVHGRTRRFWRSPEHRGPVFDKPRRAVVMIDDIEVMSDGTHIISGWALTRKDQITIEIYCDDKIIKKTERGKIRLDVFNNLSNYNDMFPGFTISWKPGEDIRSCCITAKVMSGDEIVVESRVHFVETLDLVD